MDPNVTLNNIRNLIRSIRDNSPLETGDLMDTILDKLDELDKVIDNVSALDHWLSNGGAQPDAWRNATPS